MSAACTCVLVMDFEFILRVAEKRIKSALGKSDAGKTRFSYFIMESICLDREISRYWFVLPLLTHQKKLPTL